MTGIGAVAMALIMTPIEIIGKIVKPFALTLRLFANMTAGHFVILALLGLIFIFGSWLVAGGSGAFVTFMMRSEEGRVGEEGRSRWGPDYLKKKKKKDVRDEEVIIKEEEG